MTDKIIIGLAGNIATGKSMVLRMLQELGASVIDADKLAHQLMRQGTPVHEAIVAKFGNFILTEGGEINRSYLGKVVFSVPEALEALEQITHPAVREELLKRVSGAPTPVVAVEAVKLFEAGLAAECNSRWVVVAKPEVQYRRLIEKRHMPKDQAKQRIRTQLAGEQHVKEADVVIDNSGDLGKTWAMVKKHYTNVVEAAKKEAPPTPAPAVAPEEVKPAPEESRPAEASEVTHTTPEGITVRRAKRGDLGGMAELVDQATGGAISPDISDMMESLFSRAYLVAEQDGQVLGIAGWQTENLVAGLFDFYVRDESLWDSVGETMLKTVHVEIDKLSCEVALVFVLNKAGDNPVNFFEAQEYQQTKSKKLGYIWKDAAKEWQPEDSTLLFKKLRDKRIMVPM